MYIEFGQLMAILVGSGSHSTSDTLSCTEAKESMLYVVVLLLLITNDYFLLLCSLHLVVYLNCYFC